MKYTETLDKIDSWHLKIGDSLTVDDVNYKIVKIFPMPTDIKKKAAFLESFNEYGLDLAVEHFMNGQVDVGYLLEDSDGNEHLIGEWEI